MSWQVLWPLLLCRCNEINTLSFSNIGKGHTKSKSCCFFATTFVVRYGYVEAQLAFTPYEERKDKQRLLLICILLEYFFINV